MQRERSTRDETFIRDACPAWNVLESVTEVGAALLRSVLHRDGAILFE